jgi:dephospho-CoA kinase
MNRVGITGSMGSGKTFVIKEFGKIGVPILLMDDLAKEIQISNKELIKKLVTRFPEGYPNGVLDRIKMREILFSDKTGINKKDIGNILRPYLYQEINNFYLKNKDADYVMVESALLYEYHLEDMFDCIIFVYSDPELRREKAMLRDNITIEEYNNRMKDQIPDEIKLKKSDFAIVNDFTDNVLKEINKLHKILQKWIKIN